MEEMLKNQNSIRTASSGKSAGGNMHPAIDFTDFRMQFESSYRKWLPATDIRSRLLYDAMQYSLEAGGKRIRPVLLIAACTICGGSTDEAMPFACALEFIHTYSLIHDDHPSMDNDDLRRGKPTNHKVFGDGMAVLAGDGLLNSAFEIMLAQIAKAVAGHDQARADAAVRAAGEIARAAGVRGMIAGQTADLMMSADAMPGSIDRSLAEGALADAADAAAKRADPHGSVPDPFAEDMLLYIHRNKTGAMIRAAARAGAILAGAGAQRVDDFTEFGEKTGIVFQIVDDILDVIGDEKALGKKTGVDAELGKLTYPSVYGLKNSYEIAARMTAEAVVSARNAACGDSGGEAFLSKLALDLQKRIS